MSHASETCWQHTSDIAPPETSVFAAPAPRQTMRPRPDAMKCAAVSYVLGGGDAVDAGREADDEATRWRASTRQRRGRARARTRSGRASARIPQPQRGWRAAWRLRAVSSTREESCVEAQSTQVCSARTCVMDADASVASASATRPRAKRAAASEVDDLRVSGCAGPSVASRPVSASRNSRSASTN